MSCLQLFSTPSPIRAKFGTRDRTHGVLYHAKFHRNLLNTVGTYGAKNCKFEQLYIYPRAFYVPIALTDQDQIWHAIECTHDVRLHVKFHLNNRCIL